jgi:polysaccharide biosynthesis transport protein
VVVLGLASEPLTYSSPNLLINSVVGLFFGAVLGIGAALLREFTDRRVRSDAELVQLLGVPLLGTIGAIAPRRMLALPWDRSVPRSQS